MYTFEMKDLHCMSCVKAIKEALQEKDSSAEVDGNIEKSELYVKSTLDQDAIKKTIEVAGYEFKTA
ncbi:MAG: heavy-metal-associated domain-containing protein [Oligoflexia bacterium]|nr:heavy-metal-associated domain-containing protein [Oligoflexia bacterium]MEC9282390.1 heavy-metal-associated domain-containing protein [Bdellovibrionota bacterium]